MPLEGGTPSYGGLTPQYLQNQPSNNGGGGGGSSAAWGGSYSSPSNTSAPRGGGYSGGGGGFGGGAAFNFQGSVPGITAWNPSQFNSSVQENPQIAALQGQMASYRGGLAAGNDADAQLAMGRQRDLASGMAKEGLQGALDRGFSGDSGYAQKRRLMGLDAGQSAAAGLNASLTSDARKQQMQALSNEGQLALGQAGVTQGQQNYNLSQWQAQNSASQSAAQFQAQQQQNQFQNQMNLSNANFQNQLGAAQFYTGF